jgi:hypothetical protein
MKPRSIGGGSGVCALGRDGSACACLAGLLRSLPTSLLLPWRGVVVLATRNQRLPAGVVGHPASARAVAAVIVFPRAQWNREHQRCAHHRLPGAEHPWCRPVWSGWSSPWGGSHLRRLRGIPQFGMRTRWYRASRRIGSPDSAAVARSSSMATARRCTQSGAGVVSSPVGGRTGGRVD